MTLISLESYHTPSPLLDDFGAKSKLKRDLHNWLSGNGIRYSLVEIDHEFYISIPDTKSAVRFKLTWL